MPIGMKPYVEDVSLSSEGVGPTVRRSYDPFTFHIDFSGVSPSYFMSNVEVIVNGKVIPQRLARMDELHRLLEEHVEDFVQNKRSV